MGKTGRIKRARSTKPEASSPSKTIRRNGASGVSKKKSRSNTRTNAESLQESETFPVTLHKILSDPKHEEIVCWLPHGRSWRVLQQEAFEDQIIPTYFRRGFSAFVRQADSWGFKQVSHGCDCGAFYHKLFLRNELQLCKQMKRLCAKSTAKRTKQKQNKSQNKTAVTDFYPQHQLSPSFAPDLVGSQLHGEEQGVNSTPSKQVSQEAQTAAKVLVSMRDADILNVPNQDSSSELYQSALDALQNLAKSANSDHGPAKSTTISSVGLEYSEETESKLPSGALKEACTGDADSSASLASSDNIPAVSPATSESQTHSTTSSQATVSSLASSARDRTTADHVDVADAGFSSPSYENTQPPRVPTLERNPEADVLGATCRNKSFPTPQQAPVCQTSPMPVGNSLVAAARSDAALQQLEQNFSSVESVLRHAQTSPPAPAMTSDLLASIQTPLHGEANNTKHTNPRENDLTALLRGIGAHGANRPVPATAAEIFASIQASQHANQRPTSIQTNLGLGHVLNNLETSRNIRGRESDGLLSANIFARARPAPAVPDATIQALLQQLDSTMHNQNAPHHNNILSDSPSHMLEQLLGGSTQASIARPLAALHTSGVHRPSPVSQAHRQPVMALNGVQGHPLLNGVQGHQLDLAMMQALLGQGNSF